MIENPSGKFDFTIKDKGEEVYQEFGYNSHLAATKFAQKWIKEQEETEEPKQEEPTPTPVSTYSYSIENNGVFYNLTINNKGENVFSCPGFHDRLQAAQYALGWIEAAEQAALEWIKEQEAEEPEQEPEYTYELEQYDNRWAYQIYKKGEKEYWDWEDTKEEAERAAQEWIKEQEAEEPEQEPTPAPVTTYSYSVLSHPEGGFYFTIEDKGEDVYQDFGYITHLAATQEAQEWIKEQINSYDEWLKSQRQA